MSDEPKAPGRWHTREDSGLMLDEKLQWWHDGERIDHPKIVEAFNRGLEVQPDGRVKLKFGNDWAFITVKACAFSVVAVDVVEAEKKISIRLSDRTAEWLDVGSLTLDAEGVFTCAVKEAKARARFSREAHFQLASVATDEQGALVFHIGDSTLRSSIPRSAIE